MKKKIKKIIIPTIVFLATALVLFCIFVNVENKIQYLDHIDYQVTMNKDR